MPYQSSFPKHTSNKSLLFVMKMLLSYSTIYIKYYAHELGGQEMLSKPAMLLLGIIYEKPLNAYEITKLLAYMNIKWWFNVADSTVYTTLKNLEKRGLIKGTTERIGNMPDRTIYSLTEKGRDELKESIEESILQFNYDTNIFTIAAFNMDILETETQKDLLEKRLNILQSYLAGISEQNNETWKREVPDFHVANLERMIDIVQAEISGTKRLLSVIEKEKNNEK